MSEPHFHDEISLAEEAEKLAKKAMKLKLISGFVIHFYPDSWQFSLDNEQGAEPLTPEEAYFHLKKLLEKSSQ
ncbi:MAG TPA: hypothetical protein V6C91_13330 [Coleofasciculaceae cyanobacterium]